MARLQLRPAVADAVVSFYAFGHLASAQFGPLLRSIATWLRPGGFLLANAPASPGDTVDPDWLGVPMFFGGIGQQGLRVAAEDAGLIVLSLEPITENEGDGTTATFVWMLAQRSSDSSDRKRCTA